MDYDKLIKEISDSIDNLARLRDRLYELKGKDAFGITRMKDIFHENDYSYKSKRVYNTLKMADLLEISVSSFVLQYPPHKYLRFKWAGQKSVWYIRKVLKEQCNIDW